MTDQIDAAMEQQQENLNIALAANRAARINAQLTGQSFDEYLLGLDPDAEDNLYVEIAELEERWRRRPDSHTDELLTAKYHLMAVMYGKAKKQDVARCPRCGTGMDPADTVGSYCSNLCNREGYYHG